LGGGTEKEPSSIKKEKNYLPNQGEKETTHPVPLPINGGGKGKKSGKKGKSQLGRVNHLIKTALITWEKRQRGIAELVGTGISKL